MSHPAVWVAERPRADHAAHLRSSSSLCSLGPAREGSAGQGAPGVRRDRATAQDGPGVLPAGRTRQARLSPPGNQCSHLGTRERGEGIFHPPSPGDSEESKICSQLAFLLLSFILLSCAEHRRGQICLPPSLAWSCVLLTICFPLHRQEPGACQGPTVCPEMLSLRCHFI